MSSLIIAKLVDTLVEKHGPRGRATLEIERLQSELEAQIAQTSNEEEKRRLSADVEFVKGYLETPATLMADLIGKKARARR